MVGLKAHLDCCAEQLVKQPAEQASYLWELGKLLVSQHGNMTQQLMAAVSGKQVTFAFNKSFFSCPTWPSHEGL